MVRVSWEGSQFTNSSLGLVNRRLCAELLKDETIDLSVIPIQEDDFEDDAMTSKETNAIKSRYVSSQVSADITIRQQWPPSLVPPQTPFHVFFQPWEYGSVPVEWVSFIRDYAQDVWVYSEYTKKGYVDSGVPPEQIFIVPLGVDTNVFFPDGEVYDLPTKKTFRFLFVGGTIHRKGFDRLLESYINTFTSDDDVALVVKDMGTNSFYRGQTAGEQIKTLQKDYKTPEIIYLSNDMTSQELSSLYRSCHCLVHPYRGEGFGLPILEAMACGLATIIPDKGASVDFTDKNTSFYLPSTIEYDEDNSPMGTVLPMQSIAIELDDISESMKQACSNPMLCHSKGLLAAKKAKEYTWEKAGHLVRSRIQFLIHSYTGMTHSDKTILSQINQRLAHRFEASASYRKKMYQSFTPFFRSGDRVIDLGAGDGTWVKLMQEVGIQAIGVDHDWQKVEQMHQQGLEAICGDVIEYVEQLDELIDGLSMIHIIEHMPPEEAIKILYSVKQHMKYNGRVLIVTPNYEDERVMKKNFWLDATHIRPYPPEFTLALLQEVGFRTVQSWTYADNLDSVVFGSLLANDLPSL